MENPVASFGLKDPQNQKLAEDLLRYREGIFGQYQASRQNAVVMAAQARQKAEEDLKAQYLAIPEENRNYPGIDHDFKAAAKRVEYNHQLSLLNPNDTGFEGNLKILDSKMPAKERQDFVDTDQFKNAVQTNTSNKERVTMANSLHDQLIKMKTALDAGDKVLAANIGKTGVMKTINSLQGKDAVSSGEQSTRYQDLLSLPDILIQQGEGQSPLKALVNRMAMSYQKDPKEYKNLQDKFNGLVTGAIEADPDRFYKTAYELHNAAADTSDRLVDKVIGMTSPYHAKRLLQADKPVRLPVEAAPVAPTNAPSPYAQTAPMSIPISTGAAGASAPVSSGSVQTTPAPSQGIPKGVDPALIERMRQLGIAPK